MSESTKVANIDMSVITEIESIQSKHALSNIIDLAHIVKSFTIAQGIGQMTKLLLANQSVVDCLMYLQGQKLGFRTDKIYDAKTVVACTVEALMRGLPLTGNCFNIIAGNLYIPKEGFEFLMGELKGMTDWFIHWGDYKKEGKVAKVDFKATWTFKGKEDSLSGYVPVRVNDGMIVDAIYGKATRKVTARVYGKITKSAAFFEERDSDEIDISKVAETTATSKLTATESMPDYGDSK